MRLYRALRGCSCGSRGFLKDRMMGIITGRAPPVCLLHIHRPHPCRQARGPLSRPCAVTVLRPAALAAVCCLRCARPLTYPSPTTPNHPKPPPKPPPPHTKPYVHCVSANQVRICRKHVFAQKPKRNQPQTKPNQPQTNPFWS